MAINPNWPLVVDEMALNQGYNSGSLTGVLWTSLTGRTYQSQAASRGKQYELDQARAGTLNAILTNKDGSLDPSNTGSPFSPNVLLNRAYRKRAQYPATQNLLTADQATGGEGSPLAAGTLATVAGMTSFYDANAQVVASGSAYQGTQVWSTAIGASPAAGNAILSIVGQAIQGWGSPPAYSLQVQARCVTAGTNPQVQARINWLSVTGSVISTSSSGTLTLTGAAGAAWTQVTISATPPANAVSSTIGLYLVNSPGTSGTVQNDGWQFEVAAAPTSFTIPGTWYPVFAGWVERIPQTWLFGGTYGLVQPVIADTFERLSQTTLSAAFINESLLLSPDFLFQLNDPTGSTVFADTTAKKRPASIINSAPAGPGTITAGAAITSTNPGSAFQGTPGPVTTISNPNYGSLVGGPGSAINLYAGGVAGPPAAGGWTRMIAFRAPTALTGSQSAMLWWAEDATSLNGYAMYASIIATGIEIGVAPPTFSYTLVDTTTVVTDGNWHLLMFGLDAGGLTLYLWVDGVAYSSASLTGDLHGSGINREMLGTTFSSWGLTAFNNFAGDIAFAGQFPTLLTAGQVATLYNSWRTASAGESSGARYSRILRWAGYAGATAIDTGATANMGPATDVVNRDALSALQGVVDTENGTQYVARDGTATFKARTSRYNQLTPTYIFGENLAGGEWPYTAAIGMDFDPTRLGNRALVTQTSTNQVFAANDATSQTANGTYTINRTVNSNVAAECQDAAYYLVSQYKNPKQRLARLALMPSNTSPSGLWPVILSLEIGTRVRTMRRPPSPAAAIQHDGFIEQIAPSMDDQAAATWALQISPADLTTYALFTSMHATVKTAQTAGNNTIVLNPLADAATNPAAGTLTAGQQLVFDIGLGTQETMTIAVGGVQATSPGYTSVTLTFTTNFTQNHGIGAVICEPMPAGVTSPTIYDARAIFDDATARFSY